MKDLLSKEHYYYKIYTLLMKSSVYRFFYRQPRLYELRPPFLQENLNPSFYDFLNPPPQRERKLQLTGKISSNKQVLVVWL